MTDETEPSEEFSLTKFLGGVLSDLMSNRHRGYGGLRSGGGPHPVPYIGTEKGGSLPGERFDTEYTEADIIRALVDSSLAEHVLAVRADGPFSGYILPSKIFQTSQHTFAPYTPGAPFELKRIVNAHPMRLDILIKCVTLPDGAVYIGNSDTFDVTNGYPMSEGEVMTVNTRSDVWALSTCTSQATLAMISTLREG